MTEERVKRKLSAILSADAAGYSRLMGEDEVSTVRTLEAYRKVMADLIEQFRGRVVDSPGDNLLAEFSSVVDAVQCAFEIHEVIRAKNEGLPEDRRMLFRIGVNLGDVIEEGDRIYGDGVNIAARLEGLAEPGGVCISDSAHEQIENKLALGYEYLGEHTVKNIAKPVKVYRVPMVPKVVTPREEKERKTKLKNWQWTALGAAGAIIVIIGALVIWNFYHRGPSIEPEQVLAVVEEKEAPKTIAVLPFVNLSSDPEQVYFVDGLSEELLDTLTKIPDLLVTARTSSFSFKDSNKTVQEIGSILGVDNILEGSVRKAGNELRVTAQLIRAKDGFHLWSKEYDRELDDIFSVQEDIANAVADELRLTLGIGKSLKQLGSTYSLEAYELYLVAKGHDSTIAPEAPERILELVNKALAIDQRFALAWVLKSELHFINAMGLPLDRIDSEFDAAFRAANMAIEIEPNLAEAYSVLGDYRAHKGDWIDAESAYRKAIELGSESSLRVGYSNFLPSVGYFKRNIKFYENYLRNDPFDSTTRAHYVASFVYTGDIRRAEEEYERGRMLVGDTWLWGDMMISFVRLTSGNIVSRNDITATIPQSDPIWAMAREYLESPEKGLEELHRVYVDSNLSISSLLAISTWAMYFGDYEMAMDTTERAVKLEANQMHTIWLPVMREVRQTPRFKKFVKEIGLVDYWNEFGWPDICHQLDNGDFVCD